MQTSTRSTLKTSEASSLKVNRQTLKVAKQTLSRRTTCINPALSALQLMALSTQAGRISPTSQALSTILTSPSTSFSRRSQPSNLKCQARVKSNQQSLRTTLRFPATSTWPERTHKRRSQTSLTLTATIAKIAITWTLCPCRVQVRKVESKRSDKIL